MNKFFKKTLLLLFTFFGLCLSSCANAQEKTTDILCDEDKYLANAVEVNPIRVMANETASTDLVYSIVDATNHYASVRLGKCVAEDIVVPSTVDIDSVTYTVTAVAASGFAYSDYAGTTGYDAQYLPTISTISLPDTISIIGSQAFKGTALTTFELPKLVVNINPSAFMDCRKLTTFTFAYTTVSNAKSYAVRTIGANAFEGDIRLATISLPNAITTIGNSAFRSCISLPQIILPNNITSLGTFAFENCTGAKIIYVPSTINDTATTNWGNYAFKGCTSCTGIYVSYDYPNGITAKGKWNYKTNGNYITINLNVGIMDYSDGFFYTYNDGVTPSVCTIFKYDGTDKDLVIPAKLNNRNVIAVAESAFKTRTDLTSITIGEAGVTPSSYLTTIGNNAFQGLTKVKKIDLTNACALTTIGDYAFNISTTLAATTADLFIPASVTTIGTEAFSGVTAYSSITFEDTDTNPSQLTTIKTNAFRASNMNTYSPAKDRLYDLVLPRNLTTIEEGAFAWVYGVKSITFTNNTANELTIGHWAFSRNFMCTSVTFSSVSGSSTQVGSDAFECLGGKSNNAYYNHKTLTSVYVPSTVTISGDSFDNCARCVIYRETTGNTSTTSNIDSPNSSVVNYSAKLPQYSNVDSTIITNIGTDGQIGTTGSNITTTSPSTTKRTIVRYGSTAGYFEFLTAGDATTRTLVLTKFIYTADASVYNTNVVVPSTIAINGVNYTVTSLGYGSFYSSYTNNVSTSSLLTVSLPDTVTEIGAYAFADNIYLNKISSASVFATDTVGTLPTALVTVGEYAFSSTDISACTFPTTLTNYGNNDNSTFGINSSLTTIVMKQTNNCNYATYNNAIYKKNGTNLYYNLIYVAPKYSSAFTVVDGCVIISPSALVSTKITSLTLARSVTTIGASAFYNGSSIANASYASTGTWATSSTIENNAFANCSTMASYVFPSNLTSIGYYGFYGASSLAGADLSSCTSLTTINYGCFQNCTSLTTASLPTNLTTIGTDAFNNCKKLTSIALPTGVNTIDVRTFAYCTSLTSFTFNSVVGADNFSQSVTINKRAFTSDSSLTKITLPKGVLFGSFNSTYSKDQDAELPFFGCFASATYDNGGGIYLCDSESDYVGTSSSNYKTGWNSSAYSSTSGATTIPYYFYAAKKTGYVPTTGHITGAKYWHYVDGVQTLWDGDPTD